MRRYFILIIGTLVCFSISPQLFSQELIPIMSDDVTPPQLVPYRDGKLWGYADLNGNVVIKPVFPETHFFCGELGFAGYPVYDDSTIITSYIMNKKGDILAEFPFTSTYSVTDSTVYFPGENPFIMDKHGKKFMLDTYDELRFFSGYGLAKKSNHDLVYPNTNDIAVIDSVINANTHYYLLNSYGKIIQEVGKDSAKETGVYDKNGKMIIPGWKINVINNGFTFYDESNIRYYRDQKGNVFTCAYTSYYKYGSYWYTNEDPFKNGSVIMLQENKYGLVDPSGNIIVPFGKYARMNDFSNGWSLTKVSEDNDLMIYINKNGQEMKPSSKYIFYDDFHGGFAKINFLKGKYSEGFISTAGKTMMIKKQYEAIGDFSEGLCRVTSPEGKFGFIDSTGKEAIPANLEYDEAGDFSDGLCMVRKEGLYGFIDKKGKLVIPVEHASVTPFKNGFAELSSNNCDYCAINVINQQGVKQDFYFENAYDWENGYRLCFTSANAEDINEQMMGVVSNGKLIVPAHYSWIKMYPFDIAYVVSYTHNFPAGYINLKTGIKYFKD